MKVLYHYHYHYHFYYYTQICYVFFPYKSQQAQPALLDTSRHTYFFLLLTEKRLRGGREGERQRERGREKEKEKEIREKRERARARERESERERSKRESSTIPCQSTTVLVLIF